MAVIRQPEQFQATDGREFGNQADAERYDALALAVNDFEQARKKLGRLKAQAAKTADGEFFDFSALRDYFYVHQFPLQIPSVHRVSFGFWSEVELDGPDCVNVKVKADGEPDRFYPIGELYADLAKARAAFHAALRRHIIEQQRKLAEV